jgi:hypothetical protein
MATTLTTNDANGLGYQTGFFSGTPGTPIAQNFFDAAFVGRLNTNKIYKEAYHCNIVGSCTMSTWLEDRMGYDTDCHPAYSLVETNGKYQQIKILSTKIVRAYPATSNLTLANNSQFVNQAYILPQVGNTIVLSPTGELAKVTYVAIASTGDAIVTVQLRNTAAGDQTVTAGDELLVLSGSEIADCACPTGQFAFTDLPIITDLTMRTFGDLGSLCGDALNKCQFLKIPFTDECGNVIEKWWTEALSDMYKRFEAAKHYERLLNPSWGIIPTLKARGMKWTPNSTSEITVADVRAWKLQLNDAGIMCRDYAIFAGDVLFSQWQQMLQTAGVVKLDNTLQPNDCKWIDMNYCGISVEGLRLHIYEECTFSNGKLLGSGSSVFPSSAIIVPLCDRPACTRTNGSNRQDGGGGDTKMLTTVYFKDLSGRVWDNLTDSNGILGTRNTFGTGCETQEWSIKSRFLQEIHCANQWGYMGLS